MGWSSILVPNCLEEIQSIVDDELMMPLNYHQQQSKGNADNLFCFDNNNKSIYYGKLINWFVLNCCQPMLLINLFFHRPPKLLLLQVTFVTFSVESPCNSLCFGF
jgi:hypothetical protein